MQFPRPRIPIWLPLALVLAILLGVAADTYPNLKGALRDGTIGRKKPDISMLRKVFTVSPVPSDISESYVQSRVVRDAISNWHRQTYVYADRLIPSTGQRLKIADNRDTIRDQVVTDWAVRKALEIANQWEIKNPHQLLEGVEFYFEGGHYHVISIAFPMVRQEAKPTGRALLITNLDAAIAAPLSIVNLLGLKVLIVIGSSTSLALLLLTYPIVRLTRQIIRGSEISVPWWAPIQYERLAMQLRRDREANEQFRRETAQYKLDVAIGQKMLEIAPVMLMRCQLPKHGEEAIFTYVNPAVEQQLGWSGLVGQPLNTIVPPEYGGYHKWIGLYDDELGREVGMGKCPMHGHRSRVVDATQEAKAVTATGALIDVLLSVSLLPPDEDGSLNFAGTVVDISALIAAQRKAEESAAIANSTINGIESAIIFLKNNEGVYLLCNDAFRPVAGQNPIGLKDEDLAWTTEQAAKYKDEDISVITTGEPLSVVEQVGGQPDSHWFMTRKVRVSIDGKPAMLGVSLDVDELVKARQQAENLAQEIQTVNHIAVHDIKADLTALNLGSELIQETIGELTEYMDGKADDVIVDAIETIKHFAGLNIKSARNAFDVIDQRNKLYNLESKIDITGCSVADLLDSLSAAFSSEQGELRIYNECPEDRLILADKSLLLTVLKNIVRNGFVHNESSLKRVEVKVSPVNNRSRIQITDNGVGMPQAYLESWGKVLGKAAQLSSKRGGSGTGLYSIRAIVLAHKGASIDITSTLGQGTTFILEFDHVT
jgi:PAS domain-containing protein